MSQAENNLGTPISFAEGDLIYDQGSESTGVYMILDGQIEIWRLEGEQASHIASIGAGELLGEVSVIERKNHSVTAKASKPTNALFIAAESFRRSFSDPLVRHVVNTLASRLRSSYTVSRNEQSDETTVTFKSKHPTLEGSSRLVADKFLTFIELTVFPFTVGNISSSAKHAIVNGNTLRIPLNATPELSDNHFEIIKRDGEIHIRDLGSQHGTKVNGEAISKYAMNATAKLKTRKK